VQVKFLCPGVPTVFAVLITTQYPTCSDTAFHMQSEQKAHTGIVLDKCHCRISNYVLLCNLFYYNNNYLSLPNEFNGSTHLRCDVRPHPLTRASTPANVFVVPRGGSVIGLMLDPETI
jgi:galactose-1-phosphate uridylyltransferase